MSVCAFYERSICLLKVGETIFPGQKLPVSLLLAGQQQSPVSYFPVPVLQANGIQAMG